MVARKGAETQRERLSDCELKHSQDLVLKNDEKRDAYFDDFERHEESL